MLTSALTSPDAAALLSPPSSPQPCPQQSSQFNSWIGVQRPLVGRSFTLVRGPLLGHKAILIDDTEPSRWLIQLNGQADNTLVYVPPRWIIRELSDLSPPAATAPTAAREQQPATVA